MKNLKSLANQVYVALCNPKVQALLIVAFVFAISSVDVMAQTTDPWDAAYGTISDWISGNLGLLLALVTFIIGVGISIATKSLATLGWAIVLAFVIGGLGGIAKSFFNLGGTAFGH
ncbi:TrbC/VirB2 family protein [Deferribacter abyssi]|uniref:TrbC/VirB2 family protein n=1 Tax=Deferribacter abyssi TaxID=213806 RepID=UPI003C1BF9CA